MSDDFERGYMAGDDDVRHRDKRVSRMMALALGAPALFVWATTVFVGFANATSDRPVPEYALPFVLAALALLGVLFAVLALTFAVLRTVVTHDKVIVKYGLWGPEIDLAAIESSQVVDYDATKFGGWGIRRGLGGVWAYVPGPGEAVEITYREAGETQRVQVGAQDARRLSLEINRAREAAQRVRFAGDDSAAEEEVAAAEELAENEPTQQRRR